MKRLALIVLSLSLALPHFASAEDNNKKKQAPQQHRARVNPAAARGAGPRVGPARVHPTVHVNPAIHANRNFSRGPQVHAQAQTHVNRQRHFNPQATAPNVVRQNNVRNQVNVTANSNRHFRGNGNANRNQLQHARVQQVASQRHWSRERHDRAWYRSRYHRFARFGGGYYYWNAGFWYPAYGYDPYFTYTYDAPVYGYNNLDPGQVIANVQSELQQSGYYQGDLDGLFGPMTRQALLNFQSDNGLAPTGEIDEPTLNALGLM